MQAQQKLTKLFYVDDGSTDNSLTLIKEFAARDDSVRYMSFSRNFGKEAATSAGLKIARGDAAVMIDADGQHPIEIIDQFLENGEKAVKSLSEFGAPTPKKAS